MASQADMNARKLRAGIRDGLNGRDGRDADLGAASAVNIDAVLHAISALATDMYRRFDAIDDALSRLSVAPYPIATAEDVPDDVAAELTEPYRAKMDELRARIAELEAGQTVPYVSREDRLLAIDTLGTELAMRVGAEKGRREWGKAPPGLRQSWAREMDAIEPKLADGLPLTAAEMRILRASEDFSVWREATDRHASALLNAIADAIDAKDLDQLDAINEDLERGWPE